jgi:hypothetical protein
MQAHRAILLLAMLLITHHAHVTRAQQHTASTEVTTHPVPGPGGADDSNTTTTLTCTVSGAGVSTVYAVVAAIISLVTGSVGGSVFTHRMLNSTCIKTAVFNNGSTMVSADVQMDIKDLETQLSPPIKGGILSLKKLLSLGGKS